MSKEEVIQYLIMNSDILQDNKREELFKYYCEQQLENQQLKEDYSKILETSKAYKKLLKTTMQKEHQAIKVLDEIREYIEKDYSFAKRHDIPLLTKDEQLAGKLFEILDKVKE